MSSTKLDVSGVFNLGRTGNDRAQIVLPADAVHIRKTGIEFLSPRAVPAWSELSVELQTQANSRPVRARGIVVGCHGDPQAGYAISILFLGLSRQSQNQLSRLAAPRVAV